MHQPPLGAGKVHDATSGGEKGRQVSCTQRPRCARQGSLASSRLQVSANIYLFVYLFYLITDYRFIYSFIIIYNTAVIRVTVIRYKRTGKKA